MTTIGNTTIVLTPPKMFITSHSVKNDRKANILTVLLFLEPYQCMTVGLLGSERYGTVYGGYLCGGSASLWYSPDSCP